MRRPRIPPNESDLKNGLERERWLAVVDGVHEPTVGEKYLHWDELRHRGAPDGLTHEEWWLGLKLSRRPLLRPIPLNDSGGLPFVVGIHERTVSVLYALERRLRQGGLSEPLTDETWIAGQDANDDLLRRVQIRNLREEGISTSLLEGAPTTKPRAREMFRSQQRPRDRGERMILNSYNALRHVLEIGGAPLTPEGVMELHEIVTIGTLDVPDGAGRFRRADERIEVIDARDNEVMHAPPPAKELPSRLQMMCDFANGETPKHFLHPIVRSILLHFWLAYDHPFVDGNGRCARALFYWSMFHYEFFATRFISISDLLHRAPTRYARAFLFTETDENDATYFLIHQLSIIEKAIEDLESHLKREGESRRMVLGHPELTAGLNQRQIDLVAHALRHPDARYDIRQHVTKYDVVYQTARTDLLDLAEKGLMTKRKIGRAFYFYPSPKLEEIGAA